VLRGSSKKSAIQAVFCAQIVSVKFAASFEEANKIGVQQSLALCA